MNKNNDFFEQNSRFAPLIKHYARKIGDRQAEKDLWTFLWVLLDTALVVLPDKYIMACLRNKYYDVLRERKKHTYVLLEKDVVCPEKDYDSLIDLSNALGQLDKNEKELIHDHFFKGETYTEMAEKDGTTRQAKSQKARRILTKMRGFF